MSFISIFNKTKAKLIFTLAILVLSIGIALPVQANNLPDNVYNQAVSNNIVSLPLNKRITFFANMFLGVPYGSPEFESDSFSKEYNPNEFLEMLLSKHELSYSFDKMVCVTYIEQVLALAYISDPNDYDDFTKFKAKFEKHLKAMRYHNGVDTFWERNHFASSEWLPNNQVLFSPITKDLATKPLTATAKMNRVAWVKKMYFDAIYSDRVDNLSEQYIRENVPKDHQGVNGNYSIPYISIDDELDDLEYNAAAWPEVSIVNIVRPGWDLTRAIGTELNISHQGLVIKEDDGYGNFTLYYLHATSVGERKVVKLPLAEYLNRYRDHVTIKGFNVLSVNDSMEKHLKKASHI